MTTPDYRYAIELHSSSGAVLGQVPVTPDWTAALESAAFEGFGAGISPPSVHAGGRGRADLAREAGAPYVSGFRVLGAGGFPWRFRPPTCARTRYRPRRRASRRSAGGRRDLHLPRVRLFRLAATARGAALGLLHRGRRPPAAARFEDRGRAPALIGSARRGARRRRRRLRAAGSARRSGRSGAPRRRRRNRRCLVGKLHRDPAGGDLLVEITAQLPAPHTVSQAASLTFTPDTWAAVDRALALRRRGELMLGWWHYHPDFCRKCPPENRRRCHLAATFFSAEDVNLHRTCFGRAYHVALLVSDTRREPA